MVELALRLLTTEYLLTKQKCLGWMTEMLSNQGIIFCAFLTKLKIFKKPSSEMELSIPT